MRPFDWWVLVLSLAGVALYGVWRGRGSNTTEKYLLAGKTMPWYAMALSIMATQASAITFISTTGQSYVDGMRFVQFYFGLPVAMIIIAALVVPRFHSSGVFTAYEYLERRFDAKTRALVGVIFLLQRGLGVGVALSAPAVVLTVILGIPDTITTVVMGVVVVGYTVSGGIAAVTWTDFVQMLIMTAGLAVALITLVVLLPAGVGFGDAVAVAGAAGKLNPLTFTLDWNDRYNLWSGLFGGMFLMLAYFGCDQSQVQRYLTGRSVAQSRLSLLFNAVAKIPMQFFILFIGALMFSYYSYVKPPLIFNATAAQRVERAGGFGPAQTAYDSAYEERRTAARGIVEARRRGDDAAGEQAAARFKQANRSVEAARKDGARRAGEVVGESGFNDTNYIFLSFVTRYMPVGIVGLIMAAIFAAAMSTISAEINSLATVSVIDLYQRYLKRGASDRHYLSSARWFTAFWGLYAIVTAQYAKNLGSLIEAVNLVGSLFYGGLVGVFALAFLFPRVTGNGAFIGALAGEAAIFAAKYFTGISFLWYSVLGCLVVVATGVAVSAVFPAPRPSDVDR
jgi:Na+/proline symporter